MRYIHRDDLPNYRLASKLFGRIGRSELFQTIILRKTLASVSSLKHIIQDKQLAQLVRTLIWDVNSYRVGPDARDWHEWTRHCESRAKEVDPDQAVLYLELAGNRRYWETYLSRLEEEKAAATKILVLLFRHEGSLPPLGSFVDVMLPGLRKVYILKGTSCQLENGRVRWLDRRDMLPVTRPLDIWRGDSVRRGSELNEVPAIFAVASNTTKLRIDGVNIRDYNRVRSSNLQISDRCNAVSGGYSSAFKHVSLRIRCPAPYSRFGHSNPTHLYELLRRWIHIEALRFDLQKRCGDGTTMTALPYSIRTIQDTFEIKEVAIRTADSLVTWPKLRKLSLGFFDSSPRALLSLVTRHSPTLRDLRLQHIWLDDTKETGAVEQRTWREVFDAIRRSTKLEKVALSGLFRNNQHEEDVWDFANETFARAVAHWIISGGQCPLV